MDALPRGTKRKRHEPPKEDPAVKLAGKLHHVLKEVHKAAKKARTFETQRVVKKLKGVRKKDPAADEIAVLEAELEELKTTDPDAIANNALRTRLLKDRHLAGSPALLVAVARELPLDAGEPSTSTGTKSTAPPPTKVQARLLSARTLGASVTQAVDELRAAVLPKETPTDEDGDVDMGDAKLGRGVRAMAPGDEDEDEDEDGGGEDEDGEEGEDKEGDPAGWESGSVDGADGDSDGWESGSVRSDAPPAKIAKPKATATKPAKVTTAKPAAAVSSSSQFLPSLAVGFVRGGSSDSDLDDVDADADGGGERKNRRGQRARRAIWEKKYGRGANHKKKEAEEAAAVQIKVKAKGKGRWTEGAQVADGGWAKARPTSASAPAPASAPRPYAAAPRTPAPPRTAPSKPHADAGLHPSWAAKKALKEKLGGGGIVPSQGTKIVFS